MVQSETREARVDFIMSGSHRFSESGLIEKTAWGFILSVYEGETCLGTRPLPCGEWIHEIYFAGETEPFVVGPDYTYEEDE